MSDTTPIVKGTLDILVLKALSWAPMHGPAIIDWLETNSANRLSVDESSLYYALHRMEERELITAKWGVTENNRRARYYRLTADGRSYLQTEGDRFVEYSEAVTALMRLTPRKA